MASVVVAERAKSELERLIQSRRLPADTRDRVRQSLAQLETFPLAGRRLTGRWRAFRLIVGPWPWLLLVYMYDESADTVTVVAVHDARTAASVHIRVLMAGPRSGRGRTGGARVSAASLRRRASTPPRTPPW